MRNAKARQQLERLREKLREWESAVPPRARQFQTARRNLETEVTKSLTFWSLLWIDDAVVDRFRDRVDCLDAIAAPLVELIRKADDLQPEVKRLSTEIRIEDPGLTQWLEGRCREWEGVLGRLGMLCERTSDLDRDQTLFAMIDTSVRWNREAVLQWKEAEQLLGFLGSGLTAQLAANLPELRRRLYADEAGPEWVDEIKALIQPLRPARDRIQDPPPELGNIAETLAELRRWSEVLGGHAEAEIQQLQERHFKAFAWEATDVHDLEQDAQALRGRLLDEVSALRGRKIAELEEDLADLRKAYGGVQSLQTAFDALSRSAALTHPHEFREWQYDLERYHHSFLAVAQSHIGELDARLRNTLAQVRTKLEQIESRSISLAVSDDVIRHRRQLDALPHAVDVEQILRQLRELNTIARDVHRLDQRADEEFREVDRRKIELTEKNGRLQDEIRRLKGMKIELADLGPRIATLSESATDRSLEQRRREAEELATELERLERQFVARCREELASRLLAVESAGAILRKAGAAPLATPLAPLPAGAPPSEAAAALLAAKQQYQIVIRQMREMRVALDLRRARTIAEIDRLDRENLVPGDRHEAEELLAELRAGSWSATHALMDRVDRLASLLERCDRFTQRLLRARNDALARLAELKRIFREFNDDQLYRYCPELAERVEALIHGVPAQPRQWSAVQHQLDAASELFGRVAPHARRRAAEELHHAAEALRLRIRGGGDRSGDLRDVLAELDAWGNETLPPVALRLRVLNASQRRD